MKNLKSFIGNQEVSVLQFNEKIFSSDRFLSMGACLEVGEAHHTVIHSGFYRLLGENSRGKKNNNNKKIREDAFLTVFCEESHNRCMRTGQMS